MNEREERTLDATDELVKGYVSRSAERVDTTYLIERVWASRQRNATLLETASTGCHLVVDPSTKPGSPRKIAGGLSAVLTWAAITLLAVCAAFFGGRYIGPHAASAAVSLRDVSVEHAQAIDRCYRVQYSPDPRFWDGENKLEGPSASVMWTRGDRFWSECTVGDIRLKIGQDSDGVLWVSPNPSKGIRFKNATAQLPPVVSLLCAINSMVVPKLVEEVLADFDLRSESSFAESGRRNTTLIWARLKPGRTHPLLSDALLEIDAETHVLNRLVLWTVRNGQPKGVVTYSLIDNLSFHDSCLVFDHASQGDNWYRLESHLETDAEIESGTFTTSADTLATPTL
jgi:hypothetical protein